MKIESSDCSYQATECDYKFGKEITVDGCKTIVIPKGATKGDVIRIMFPEARYREDYNFASEKNGMYMHILGVTYSHFSLDWWNSPFEEE